MSEKLEKLWEVLEASSSRMKLEEAMKQAGYSPAEIQELEDGNPELGQWMKVTFNDLKKSIRRDRLFKGFVHSDRFHHLMLLRHKASHYALDALFAQYKINWRDAEELSKK